MADRTDVERLMGGQFRDPEVQQLLARYDAAPEVEDEDGQIAWLSRPSGLELHADSASGRITTVYAYGDAKLFRPFTGELPGGLPITATREQVRAHFGAPDKSGSSHDFWQRDGYNVSVQYVPSGAIKLLALM